MNETLTQEVIEQALAHDARAMKVLIKELTRVFQLEASFTLWRYGQVLRGLTPKEAVRDLVQEIFAALFKDDAAALRRWNPELGRSPASYFRVFARFQCKTYCRKEWKNAAKEVVTESDDLADLLVDDLAEEELTQRSQLRQKLERIESELSAEDHDLFLRIYLRHQSTQQICEDLQITTAAYFQRKTRLLKRMRDLGILEAELAKDSSPGSDPAAPKKAG